MPTPATPPNPPLTEANYRPSEVVESTDTASTDAPQSIRRRSSWLAGLMGSFTSDRGTQYLSRRVQYGGSSGSDQPEMSMD